MGLGFWGLLGQWLDFKLFGITYLVGENKPFKLFFQGPGRLSEQEKLWGKLGENW